MIDGEISNLLRYLRDQRAGMALAGSPSDCPAAAARLFAKMVKGSPGYLQR
jgi:hypothetical protein